MVLFTSSMPSGGLWPLFSRLGEAQILLPALAFVLAWFVARLKAFSVARTWVLCIGAAALLTTATKIAFIGWGVGWPALDFTGISGHSMFAAAVMPVLAATLASTMPPPARSFAIAAGYAFAIGIAVSRVEVGAHSVSEAVAGFVVGSLASGLALRLQAAPRTHLPRTLMVLALVWLAVTPVSAPPSQTHNWVTQIALALSGHDRPYTRYMMLKQYRRQYRPQQQQLQALAAPGS